MKSRTLSPGPGKAPPRRQGGAGGREGVDPGFADG